MKTHSKKLYLGFLQMHILHHASQEPIYGALMIEELNHHGYQIGPSHIYPLLNTMTQDGLLSMNEQLIQGKIRKYYQTTELGVEVLRDLIEKLKELASEILVIPEEPLGE